jgi:hypothetical protein
MTESTEGTVPETEFSDDLSDEALDRQEASPFSRGAPCTKAGCQRE